MQEKEDDNYQAEGGGKVEDQKPVKWYWQRIWNNFDRSFLVCLAFLYVNGGFKALYELALWETLKTQYKMEADQVAVARGFIMSPWGVKIFYGIICDVFRLPFFNKGSKRGYIILWATTQFICFLLCGIFTFNQTAFVNMFFVSTLAGAFMDTVIDGINCVQQRLDPVHGA